MTAMISEPVSLQALGDETIDRSHQEFAELLLALAKADLAEFIRLFAALVAHAEEHFGAEQHMMRHYNYPAERMETHLSEHLRVLRDLKSIHAMVARGSVLMARTYVTEQLPYWFTRHNSSHDAELVEHLKNYQAARGKAS
ncbi:hemerythrin-like metal-binding protein [Alteromonadaceae bacterium 2753L.S.0a.02]|nr:hemerythrin-like metal-binding protein [Alteromonadaceae bacterium 2753L.S.0a.02]